MADLKVTGAAGSSGPQGLMTSSVTEALWNAKATFTVKKLLDQHELLMRRDVQQQHQQHVNDARVSGAADGRSPKHTTQNDTRIEVGTPAGARIHETSSLSTAAAASPSPWHRGFADMPDLVQTSTVMDSCYDQDNYARWILQPTASLDYCSGLGSQCGGRRDCDSTAERDFHASDRSRTEVEWRRYCSHVAARSQKRF